MALELVLLVPVLVLLTVFVLWAGRGGRAALTADLAAEEAATAAALCCEEDVAGEPDRDMVVEDMLTARPGLEFLCVGGLRPEAPADTAGDPDEFVQERWLDFEPGSDARSGGVGILDVQFGCETDGAVAPLRGLFPTVKFSGQASEVVIRRPAPPNIGFQFTTFTAREDDSTLTFVVTSPVPVPQDVQVDYAVISVDPGLDLTPLVPPGTPLPVTGDVRMLQGDAAVFIEVPLSEVDVWFEGTERLTVELTGLRDPVTGVALPASIVKLDLDRDTAVGEVIDDDPEPRIFLHATTPCTVNEGGSVSFEVRLRDPNNTSMEAPTASTVEVDFATSDGTATVADGDYTEVDTRLTFGPGVHTLPVPSDQLEVQTLDDVNSPVGELSETFKVTLSGNAGAQLGTVTEVTCTILDDEVRVSVADVSVDEGGQLVFSLSLDRDRAADITVAYRLVDDNLAAYPAARGTAASCVTGDDYRQFDSMSTVSSSHTGSVVDYVVRTIPITAAHDRRVPVALPGVATCDDDIVERGETFWLEIFIPRCPDPPVAGCINGGEAVVEAPEGARGTIDDNDTPTVSITPNPADATGTEGQTAPLEFTVDLTVNGGSGQLSEEITVDYTVGGTTATATAPGSADADYTMSLDTATPTQLSGATLSGTLTFAVGPTAVTEHVFEAELLADYLPEGDETFEVDLDNLVDPVGVAVFADDGDPSTDDTLVVATIVEERPPGLSVGDFTGPEGTDQNFVVTLSDPRSGETVTVEYDIAGTGTDPATDPAAGVTDHDYTAVSGVLTRTLTFIAPAILTPGDTLDQTVGVSLLRDQLNERDETLRLTLRNPSGAVLTDRDPLTPGVQAYGQGTIVNVDGPRLFVDDTSAREGEELTFTVTLCNPFAGETVTVDYGTKAHSAAAGLDFTATNGKLTFSDDPLDPDYVATQRVTSGCGAGVTADAKPLTVVVATLPDLPDESDEEVHLILSAQTPAHIGFGDGLGVGRIINVSAATVRVTSPTAVEGDPLSFVITLEDNDGNPAVITQSVAVNYETVAGTADAGTTCATGTDYISPGAGSFTFTPNSAVRSVPVTVQTCTDTDDEDDETVALVLTVAAGSAGLGDSEGTGTILDVTPDLTIGHGTAEEGDPLEFEVTLRLDGQRTAASQTVSFDVFTEDGTATAGDDYTTFQDRREIPVGQSSVTFEVETLVDDIYEPPETVRVVLSDPQGAHIDGGVGIGTITEACITIDGDDDPGAFIAHDTDVLESQVSAVVRMSLTRPLCEDTAITIRSSAGTADGGDQAATTDYTSIGGRDGEYRESTLRATSFGFGHTQFAVRSLEIHSDQRDEDNEWFEVEVNWSSSLPPKFQGKPEATARVTIIDDDPEPILRIAEAPALEGEAITFEVSMDPPTTPPGPCCLHSSWVSERDVTVQYRTVPGSGTAASGVDYTPSGWTTLRFPAMQPTATFTVQTASDTAVEGSETFLVELRNPHHATIGDGAAWGTILEENLPELRIYDAAVDEGATDTTMMLRVELSEAAAHTVTVDYSTVERPAGLRAAEEGADYEPVSAQPLEFQPGGTVRFAQVTVKADSIPEVDETFLVELANPSGAALGGATAVGTINGEVTCMEVLDFHDVPPVWTLDPVTAPEDSAAMAFVFVLDEPVCDGFQMNFLTNPRRSTARPNVDFYGMFERRTFPMLTEIIRFEVPLIDDDLNEGDETIVLQLSNPAGQPDLFVTGTIIDDDAVVVSVDDASTSEGDELSFAVRLNVPSERNVVVDYATEEASPVSAVTGVDYTSATSQIIIPAGQLAAQVRLRTLEDALDELDETLSLVLSNAQVLWSPPQAASFAPGGDSGVGTITDDDPPPQARVSDAAAGEGEALEFVVTLDAPSGRTVVIPVATRDGTATVAGGDYQALATDVEFAPGVTRRIVAVQTLTDAETEGSEHIWLDLGPMPFGNDTATIGDDIGRGVIRDVTDRRVSVSDAVAIEGGTLAFEVSFAEEPSGRDVTVRYRTAAGTATAGDDYHDDFESATRELKIIAGDTSATVLVPTVNDRLDEHNETLELELSRPDGAVIADGTASGVIIDDDPEPALRVADTEATEADGASAVFTLSLSEPSGRDVTVDYRTNDGTATVANGDYTAPAPDATETITAGHTTATVDVALVNDDIEEEVETFQLEVTAAANAQRDDSVGVATIIDDDGPIQILVDDPADAYESAGASVAFTVRLSRADPANPVTVMYSTVDGTADAGADYNAASSQTLIFAAGSEEETVTVTLVNDDVAEDPETFDLVLSAPSSNAEIGDDTATALILDDDALPTLSVADADAAVEGAAATFTITLSAAAAHDVTVDYATITDPTAPDETAATAGLDYTATTGTATIAARATTATVTVALPDDTFDENTETFWLRLANPSGATIVDGTAGATINDDDPLPAVDVFDAGATEGSTLSFEVQLDALSGRTVTVPWTTEARPPGLGAASPGVDYTTASGTATLAPGTTTARLEVQSLQDEIDEADETFLVQLGTPVNAALDDDVALGAIRDDDGEPRVFILDTTVDEDDGPAIFAVTLSHTSSQPVTVEYETADGTATNPDDYAPDQVKTLTIPATGTQGEISVFIVDDTDAEGAETFTITLTNPVNAVIATGAGTATGTILDDDGPPQASIAAATASEGDGAITFEVTLSHASTATASLQYTTFDGTAVQPDDYTAATGTLAIAPGDTTATITVALTDDNFFEDPESFLLRLHDPIGAEIDTAEAVGVIVDDDELPIVAWNGDLFHVREDGGSITLEVVLDRASDREVRVDLDYGISGLGSAAGCPRIWWPHASFTVVFAPGDTARTVTFDLIHDPAECSHRGRNYTQYLFRLEDPVNARLGEFVSYYITGNTLIFVNVYDVERPPQVRISGSTVLENAGSAPLTIAIPVTSDDDVTVSYDDYVSTVNPPYQRAQPGVDYAEMTGDTATIVAGQLKTTVTVPIIDDNLVETGEVFRVQITPVDNAETRPTTNADKAGVVIVDDDDIPSLSATNTEVTEDAGVAVVLVDLEFVASQTVTVDYETVDGTAAAPGDYTAVTGTLTFASGETRKHVEVPLVADNQPENQEEFYLRFSDAVGATAPSDATITIAADGGALPVASLTVLDVVEGDERAWMTLTLSEPSPTPVSVEWSWVEVPSLGVHAADLSDVGNYGGFWTITIPANQTIWTFWRAVNDDDIPEWDERIIVALHDPVGVAIATPQAWLTIVDDDLPILSAADEAASEGDGFVEFELRLHAPGVEASSVAFTTRPRLTGSPAEPGEDYTHTSGTVTFAASQQTATVRVPVIGDGADEPDETFLLELSSPDGLDLSDAIAVGTITDDDDGHWISDRSVWEYAATMDFTVQRDHTSPAPVTVDYRSGTAGSAVGATACTDAGADYVIPSGTVTIPADATAATISIDICDDDDPEGRENLLIELTGVTGRQTTAVGTILDDDGLPTISIGDICVVEGGITQWTAPLLSHAHTRTVEWSMSVTGGTATYGTDILPFDLTGSFAPGDTQNTIDLYASSDFGRPEGTETLELQLSLLTDNALLGNATATVTILDDASCP